MTTEVQPTEPAKANKKIKLRILGLIAIVAVAAGGYYYGTRYIHNADEIRRVSAELVNQQMGEPCCVEVVSLQKNSESTFTAIAVLNDGTRLTLDILQHGGRIEVTSSDPAFLAAAISRKGTLDKLTAMLKDAIPQGDFQCVQIEDVKSAPESCAAVAVLNDGHKIKIQRTPKELRIEPQDLARISLITNALADATKKLNYYKIDSDRCVKLEEWQPTGKTDCFSGVAVTESGRKYKIKVDADRDGLFLSIQEPEFVKQWALESINENLKKNNAEFSCKDILKVKTIGDAKYTGVLMLSDNSLVDVEFEDLGRYISYKGTPRQ